VKKLKAEAAEEILIELQAVPGLSMLADELNGQKKEW
jgi:hypothetical protein